MSDGRASGGLALAAGLLALALVGLGLLVASAPPPSDEPPAPRATRRPAGPAPRSIRVSLPAPAGRPRPQPAEAPPPAALDPDTKREMNQAVDELLRTVRAECLQGWVEALPESASGELVFDVVLHDGEVADLGLRSLDEPVPEDAVACAADTLWSAEWSSFGDLPGELRLQRTVALGRGASR